MSVSLNVFSEGWKCNFRAPNFKNFPGACPHTHLRVTKYEPPQTKPKLYAYDCSDRRQTYYEVDLLCT